MTAVAERCVLRAEAWADYAHATQGEHFAWWARTRLVQSQGQWSGEALVLEPDWQLPLMMEALAVNTDGSPFWRVVGAVMPRKNAKTTTLGGYAIYELDEGAGQPEVLLAGSTDLQSGRLFDTGARFIRRNPYLARRFRIRQHVGEIERIDGGAKAYRVATTNADSQHGWNPSKAICDELHAWNKPVLREAWDALTTAGDARLNSQVFFITTPGRASARRTGLLGPLVDGNRLIGEVERLAGCTISRNFDSRVIIFEFHAPDAAAADPKPLRKVVGELRAAEERGDDAEADAARVRRDELAARLVRSVRLANPASWIRDESILKKAIGPTPTPSAFLRLSAGLWADDEDTYISDTTWESLGGAHLTIPDGADVCLGIDGSRTHDCTVVSWSTWSGSTIRTACRVFAAREDAPHHELCPGGRIDYDRVETFIADLFDRFRVVDAAYDPRYLDRSADILRARLPGARIVPVEPTSAHMKSAVSALERLTVDRLLEHDGDQVLAAHIANTVAIRHAGYTRLTKIDDDDAIDATVATALSVWRAKHHAERAARTTGELVVVDLAAIDTGQAWEDDDDSEAAMIRRLRAEGLL